MNYHYRILESVLCHDGFFKLAKYQLEHELFNGDWSRQLSRECLQVGRAVAVLPYDPLRDELLFIEQFRVGALTADKSQPWLIEIVAGLAKPDELLTAVAHREAIEEANCALGPLHLIADYYSAPGATNERLALFCGRADLSTAGGVHGLPEEGEDIRLHVISRAEAADWMLAGRIRTAPALIAVLWLMQHYEQLQKRWRD